jgi:hypothetical protein
VVTMPAMIAARKPDRDGARLSMIGLPVSMADFLSISCRFLGCSQSIRSWGYGTPRSTGSLWATGANERVDS